MTSTKLSQTEDLDQPLFHEKNNEEKSVSKSQRLARNQIKIPQSQSRRPNVVIGRFKEKEMMGDGSLLRQHKGRAALTSNQEELVTLSKGWINFYMLRESQDFGSDVSSPDETIIKQVEEKLLDRRGTEKTEEVIKQYTLEIQATPESLLSTKKESTTVLPDLKTKRFKKREKQVTAAPAEEQDLVLPDIPSSSSSSSPDSAPRLPESPPRLPDLRKEKKSSRIAKKQRREKGSPSPDHISKSQRLLKLPPESESGAVEIAHSEHSVSSVTSSAVIMSESPSSEKMKLSERRLQKHRQDTTLSTRQTTCINNTGNSWSVTVAGSSGSSRHPPPDVEMKLSFGNREKGSSVKERHTEPVSNDLVRYGQPQTAARNHTRTSRQQEKAIEDKLDTTRSDQKPLRGLPNAPSTMSHNFKKEKNIKSKVDATKEPLSSRVPSALDYVDAMQRNLCRMCSKDQRDSGSEFSAANGAGELQLTGMAITPEIKPRVTTQSERDPLKARRYKFTR